MTFVFVKVTITMYLIINKINKISRNLIYEIGSHFRIKFYIHSIKYCANNFLK
jgi:hypothetical protein